MIVKISKRGKELARQSVPSIDEPDSIRRSQATIPGWGLLSVSRVDNDVTVAVYPTESQRSSWDGKIFPVSSCQLKIGNPELCSGTLKHGLFGWRGKLFVSLVDTVGVVR